ncbi:hypothetical protein [Streptococcus pneumoniae]|uniref:hypothetical protein n=1 Tax=Streptococcus pneumoniae TaxID=1313 RepID=UPI00186B2FC0|nr:hypothetical protein [Streptococcus pneumoniae]
MELTKSAQNTVLRLDRTDEVSNHTDEVSNHTDRTDEVSNHTHGKATLTWFELDFRRV